MKKETQPSKDAWAEPLRRHLESCLKGKFRGLKNCRDRALTEIIHGTQFCICNKLKLFVTLQKSFDIGSACNCLAAKNVRYLESERFSIFLRQQGLSQDDGQALGFNQSRSFRDAYFQGRGYQRGLENESWRSWCEIYNYLWREVGKFFMAHHEFGVVK